MGLHIAAVTGAPGWISEEEYIDLLLEHGVAGIIFVRGARGHHGGISRYPSCERPGCHWYS